MLTINIRKSFYVGKKSALCLRRMKQTVSESFKKMVVFKILPFSDLLTTVNKLFRI